jgi:hypothetical protein
VDLCSTCDVRQHRKGARQTHKRSPLIDKAKGETPIDDRMEKRQELEPVDESEQQQKEAQKAQLEEEARRRREEEEMEEEEAEEEQQETETRQLQALTMLHGKLRHAPSPFHGCSCCHRRRCCCRSGANTLGLHIIPLLCNIADVMTLHTCLHEHTATTYQCHCAL